MTLRERIARKLAKAAGHANPDRLGTKATPYVVDGIRYEEPMMPTWTFYLDQADVVLNLLQESEEQRHALRTALTELKEWIEIDCDAELPSPKTDSALAMALH